MLFENALLEYSINNSVDITENPVLCSGKSNARPSGNYPAALKVGS
jgi:hypothetical protein